MWAFMYVTNTVLGSHNPPQQETQFYPEKVREPPEVILERVGLGVHSYHQRPCILEQGPGPSSLLYRCWLSYGNQNPGRKCGTDIRKFQTIHLWWRQPLHWRKMKLQVMVWVFCEKEGHVHSFWVSWGLILKYLCFTDVWTTQCE